MINRTTNTEVVKDWREVVPIVEPFYERFTGEEIPNLENIVGLFSEQERSDHPEILGICKFNSESKNIKLALCSFEITAHNLFHELLHRAYELEHELTLKYKSAASKNNNCSKDERKKAKKEFHKIIFLHECVAYAGSFVFNSLFLNNKGEYEDPKYQVFPSIGSARQAFLLAELELEKELPGFETRVMYTRQIGVYISAKYQNDPQLWSKLKQLRTLNDLRRLVDG
ncbi:hypothetical protein HZA97_10135 [Candidatus Woesearchaeota archaeon]|nr:hypothetical protein [Candidatus Woesearchaeota archaeon]